MSSYAQPTQRRRRGHTESATTYKRQFPDALSPEYASAGRPQHHSGVYAYGANNAGTAVDQDIRHALYAQERARARRAAIDSSPRRALPSPSRSGVTPSAGYETTTKSPVYPSTVSMDGYSFPAARSAPSVQIVQTSNHSHGRRFSNLRDSLSLPYHGKKSRTKLKPPALDLRHLVNDRMRIGVDQPGYSASELGRIRTPPQGTPVARESPKQLAPLPRFNPFARTRADSLSALVEDHHSETYYELDQEEEDMTPTTPNTRMRRMKSVNDLFSRINGEAQRLGLKTSIYQ